MRTMLQPGLGQGCNDLENPPVDRVAISFREELQNRALTWRVVLILIGLLFLVSTLNMTLFFVLRSVFTPSILPPSPAVPSDLIRELALIRETFNAKDVRNGTDNSTCKEQNTVKKENSLVSKSCGGVISISRSQKGYLVNDKGDNERCAWIIQSEVKRIKVQYGSYSLGRSSGTVIGEVGDGYVGLSCSKLSRTDSQIVSTPFVLYFTEEDSRLSFDPIKMVLELTPVDDEDFHANQPAAYHVNKMSGSGTLHLGGASVTSRTLLEKITVFQKPGSYGSGRQLGCSPTGTNKCCDYIDAYIMDDFSKDKSCHKILALNEGNGKLTTDATVVVLQYAYKNSKKSQCRLTWENCGSRKAYCGLMYRPVH